MKLEIIHRTIINVLSKGHIQLRELTDQVNSILGTNYLESTLSARIRELPKGCYETLNQSRHIHYIALRGSKTRLNEKYGRKAA